VHTGVRVLVQARISLDVVQVYVVVLVRREPDRRAPQVAVVVRMRARHAFVHFMSQSGRHGYFPSFASDISVVPLTAAGEVA